MPTPRSTRCATGSPRASTPPSRIACSRGVHEIVVDDAVQVWVVHDTNPHALSAKVKGYTQAQHWFQDFTTLA